MAYPNLENEKPEDPTQLIKTTTHEKIKNLT